MEKATRDASMVTIARRRHRRAAPGALDRRVPDAPGCLTALNTLPAGVATVAGASPNPDAELVDLCGQYIAWNRADRARRDNMTQTEWLASICGKPAPWTAAARQTPDKLLVDRIAALPASTSEGLRSKAEALRWYYGGNDQTDPFDWRHEDKLIGSMLRDILGRIGA